MSKRAKAAWFAGVLLATMALAAATWAQEQVMQDVVKILGDVTIPAETRVQGNVVAIGGSVTVYGTVTGDAVAILGGVILGPQAVVSGQVVTIGGELQRAPGAQVRGGVTAVSVGAGIRNLPRMGGLNIRFHPWATGTFRVFYVAGLFALALVFLALAPRPVQVVAGAIEAEPARSALWGLAAFTLLGPAMVLFAITIVGIPVALGLLLAAIFARFMGYVGLSLFFGGRILNLIRDSTALSPAWSLLVGSAIIGVVTAIPMVGWMVSVGLSLVGTGAVLMSKFGSGRPWFPARPQGNPNPNPGPGNVA
ncbi:MAG: polymer-forming cytoskeletal protein [Bacillota bacterium]